MSREKKWPVHTVNRQVVRRLIADKAELARYDRQRYDGSMAGE